MNLLYLESLEPQFPHFLNLSPGTPRFIEEIGNLKSNRQILFVLGLYSVGNLHYLNLYAMLVMTRSNYI